MANHETIKERTPNGGAYSEIYYLDKDGKVVDESIAVKCVIRECDKNGELIMETFGVLKKLSE